MILAKCLERWLAHSIYSVKATYYYYCYYSQNTGVSALGNTKGGVITIEMDF